MDTTTFSTAQLQQWMQRLITGKGAATGDTPLPIGDVVNASSRLSAARHLRIYQGSYIARLRECMRTQFSALAYALGTELFDAFTDQYLETYPSHSYTLNELGRNFANFLQATRPDAHEQQKESWPDFMIELAAFEYAISLIFDQPATEDITLATPATPDEALTLIPVFHLFSHTFPVCNYYLDFKHDRKPGLPFPAQSHCVVLRQHYKLGLFTINPSQNHFLTALKNGDSIPAALNKLTGSNTDLLWGEWRKHFIESGFFCV